MVSFFFSVIVIIILELQSISRRVSILIWHDWQDVISYDQWTHTWSTHTHTSTQYKSTRHRWLERIGDKNNKLLGYKAFFLCKKNMTIFWNFSCIENWLLQNNNNDNDDHWFLLNYWTIFSKNSWSIAGQSRSVSQSINIRCKVKVHTIIYFF